MTSTTFARGCEWCSTCLYSGWGDNLTDEQIAALGGLVVGRFEQLCAEAGDPSIAWFPRLSEVIGECMGETTDEYHWSTPVHDVDLDLDALREQAQTEVCDALCGYDTPMSARVREVLNVEMTVTEATRQTGVPRSSITWAIRTGKFPAETRGRAWVFMSSDFEDWLAARPGRGRHATGASTRPVVSGQKEDGSG